LESQVLWGEQTVAREFATLLGGGLGFPNAGNDLSPFFGFTVPVGFPEDPVVFAQPFQESTGLVRAVAVRSDFTGVNLTWAVAEKVNPVPLPAGGLLLLTGLATAAGLGYRKTRRG